MRTVYSIRSNLRIAKTNKLSSENLVLVDNATNDKYMINKAMYEIIRYVNDNEIQSTDLENALSQEFQINPETLKSILDYLHQEKIIYPSSTKHSNKNILNLYSGKYILNRIALEVTEHCNLRCKHCYGDFGNKAPKTLSLNFIKSLIPELDKLNAHSVMLTGGEFFLHPHYSEIFTLFKTKGYSLSLLTNGFLIDRIKAFVKKNQDVSFILKVSLDGFEDTHNYLRGNDESYKRAFETLTFLKDYPNITPYVSISIGKHNVDSIREFKNFVKSKFCFTTTSDLMFPTDFNCNFQEMIFLPKDFDELYSKYPEYFKNKTTNGTKSDKNSPRCIAAREMATLSANKILKICNNAVAEKFHFGSLKNTSLTELWEHPPAEIQAFREERNCDVLGCSQCNFYTRCTVTNCRTLAHYYTGDSRNPNPILCFAQTKLQK